jgi:hypothetical protein
MAPVGCQPVGASFDANGAVELRTEQAKFFTQDVPRFVGRLELDNPFLPLEAGYILSSSAHAGA